MRLRLLLLIKRWHPRFHRPVHDGSLTNGPGAACWYCRAVWAGMLRIPEFKADLDAGLADVAAGRTRPWSEVKAELDARPSETHERND